MSGRPAAARGGSGQGSNQGTDPLPTDAASMSATSSDPRGHACFNRWVKGTSQDDVRPAFRRPKSCRSGSRQLFAVDLRSSEAVGVARMMAAVRGAVHVVLLALPLALVGGGGCGGSQAQG